MKQLTCEMCGSHDLIKQDGVYICPRCGVRYSVEEAKKMMVEGTICIDDTKELNNFLIRAKLFLEETNFIAANEYAEKALDMAPEYSEAYVIKLLCELKYKNEREAYEDTEGREVLLSSNANYIKAIRYADETRRREIQKFGNVEYWYATQLMESVKIGVIEGGPVEWSLKFLERRMDICKKAIHLFTDLGDWLDSREKLLNCENRLAEMKNKKEELVQKKQVQHQQTTIKNKGNQAGCYVATCVYGAYDCPQVWTLRRYRDNQLATTWYGRAFIFVYYAISPTLVKWFGKTKWFKKIWKAKLDKMVKKLQEQGVENTPYNDKQW